MISNIGQALDIRKAQTVTGYLVTGLEKKTDAMTRQTYLFGWSWEPQPQGHGCLGANRWNLDGSVRDGESRTELVDWVNAI